MRDGYSIRLYGTMAHPERLWVSRFYFVRQGHCRFEIEGGGPSSIWRLAT